MGNNEIYIDGVNVAGCEYYEDGMCNACRNCDGYTDIECRFENPNCYYKQLQRLKQENFALTQESQQKSQTICELNQENEALKKEVKQIRTYEELKLNKYRSALEEIREIAEENITCASYNCPPMIKIQDKINEVL